MQSRDMQSTCSTWNSQHPTGMRSGMRSTGRGVCFTWNYLHPRDMQITRSEWNSPHPRDMKHHRSTWDPQLPRDSQNPPGLELSIFGSTWNNENRGTTCTRETCESPLPRGTPNTREACKALIPRGTFCTRKRMPTNQLETNIRKQQRHLTSKRPPDRGTNNTG